MMAGLNARRIQLEVFDLMDLTKDRIEITEDDLEERRLRAYEEGYAAGWDDAVAAQTEDVGRLRGELGQNLEDLAFTYREAHSHVLRALRPLLFEMSAKVLPELARKSLGALILERLEAVAGGLAEAPVVLASHPANRTLIEETVCAQAKFPILFREDPTLGQGQVDLIFGVQQSRIDLDGVITAISEAVEGFFELEEEQAHG